MSNHATALLRAEPGIGDPATQAIHRVSIIVPTLNEIENIDLVMEAILSQSDEALGFEILVADGGSTDGTLDRVLEWEAFADVRLVYGGGARGLAGDVLKAAAQATNDIVVVMDADLSHPADRIHALVKPVREGLADIAIGSRYVPGGETPGWPLHRRLLSRFGGLLARPLTDVRDPMSGFFAVRRDRLLAIDSGAAGFKIGLELIMQGGEEMRTIEIPISFVDRTLGTSKIGPTQLLAYLRRLLVLAGATLSVGNATRLALAGVLGFCIDLLTFEALRSIGTPTGSAHVASFVAATISNYLVGSRYLFRQSTRSPSTSFAMYLRFLVVCVLALAVRGGTLSTLTGFEGVPTELAIFAAILAAAFVNVLGVTFFVCPQQTTRVSGSTRWRLAAVGVVGYVVMLRFLFIGVIDLIPQEAYYWNYAQHLDIGYLDHPPMVAWLIWVGTALFGDTEFAVRISAFLCWLIAAGFIVALTARIANTSAAFVSLLLMATLPFFFAIGFVMTPDAPLTAAWAGALYFLYRALIEGRCRAWLGAGLCMGLGMLSKYTIVLLAPAALVFLLIDPIARGWLKKPHPYLAGALALLIFSPVIFWNIINDFASFAFQSADRLEGELRFNFPSLVINAAGLLTPIGLAGAIGVLWHPLSTTGTTSTDHQKRVERFLAIFVLIPLGIFILASFLGDTKLNWTGPIWLMSVPPIAAMIVTVSEQNTRIARFVQRTAVTTVVVSLILYGSLLNVLAFGFDLFDKHASVPRQPIAWSEFGDQVSTISQRVETETGRTPILVAMDKYNVASELAFYAGGDSVGCGILGLPSLMYAYWYKAEDFHGSDIILLSFDRRALESPEVLRKFEATSTPEQRIVLKNGQPAGVFYYRVGYGFMPPNEWGAR